MTDSNSYLTEPLLRSNLGIHKKKKKHRKDGFKVSSDTGKLMADSTRGKKVRMARFGLGTNRMTVVLAY